MYFYGEPGPRGDRLDEEEEDDNAENDRLLNEIMKAITEAKPPKFNY